MLKKKKRKGGTFFNSCLPSQIFLSEEEVGGGGGVCGEGVNLPMWNYYSPCFSPTIFVKGKQRKKNTVPTLFINYLCTTVFSLWMRNEGEG